MSVSLCNKHTRKGTCHIPLRGGVCFLHDRTDLAARNAKVANAFRENNPEAFRAQRVASGKRGFQKVGGMIWWAEQTEKARLWRIEHPSAHEQTLCELLTRLLALDVHYDRDVIINGDPRAVDVILYRDGVARAAIEATESRQHVTFGRAEKLARKVAWLEDLGIPTHIFFGADDLQTEVERLGKFLEEHNLN